MFVLTGGETAPLRRTKSAEAQIRLSIKSLSYSYSYSLQHEEEGGSFQSTLDQNVSSQLAECTVATVAQPVIRKRRYVGSK